MSGELSPTPPLDLPREIETERLILRRWHADDHEPFFAINTDARVMEFLGEPVTREQNDAAIGRIAAHFERNGFGVWATEVRGVAPFIGFIGLLRPRFEAHFTPCVEVGWRLAADHWGKGYATEGARACVLFAFERLQLAELVSMTVVANRRSRNVMQKLGMTHDPADDFDHPLVPEGSPLKRHVLYRGTRETMIASV